MPNWCSNHVIVEGPEENILNLISSASQGVDENGINNVFSFENIIPTPENELNGEGWYSWRLANWGTKWDLNQSLIEFKEPVEGGATGCLVFEMFYDTAWSPASHFWSNVCKQFPNLKITEEFFEEGCEFLGQTYYSADFVEKIDVMLDTKMYVKAGAVLNDEGYVDWDIDQDYNLWSCFPLGNDF